MEIMASVWRSLTLSGGAAHVDATVAKALLESIQRALLDAFQAQHKRRDVGTGAASSGARALTADEIAPIRALCDQLTPAHFQLKVPDVPSSGRHRGSSSNGGRNCVKYQHIWENELFSMGIFILPPGASIPLHDHPEMTVISRVLYGSLHVTSCDLVPPKEAEQILSPSHGLSPVSASNASRRHRRLARIFQDEAVTAPHTTALLPNQGNLHEFVADDTQGCAIFDILTPPYEPDDGRDCTYFRVMSDELETESGARLVELEEFDPYNFEVVSEPYRGPRLSEHPPLAPPLSSMPRA